MVLLVKHVACAWRTHHVVDAVPNVTIAWRGRVVAVTTCFGVRQAVAALPCRSAVLGSEDAGRRDSNPELFWIARIKNDGVQHQPGSTGVPVIGRGVIRQSMFRTHSLPPFLLARRFAGLVPAYSVPCA